MVGRNREVKRLSMILQKWNYEKHEYEPYEVPDDWHVSIFSLDMDEIINCVQCGCEVKFGECFTSKEVHNNFGFGYMVCDKCYEKEWVRSRNKTE